MAKKPKKIAICHYRVGGTDGVALEIEKRKKVLEQLGCTVKLIAGHRSRGADYVIRGLEWDDGLIPIIKENGFLYFNRKDLDDDEIKRKINRTVDGIRAKLDDIQQKEKFDYLMVHNIFSFAGHLAAAKAMAKWIEVNKIPTLATHHDFYWERKEYSLPRNSYLRNYLDKFMPPVSPHIQHVVINTLAQKELFKRSGIRASVLPDIFDFSQKPWEVDNFNRNFLRDMDISPNDLIILQATRIIPRKGIEIAIDLAGEIDRKMHQLKGKTIYNGKKIKTHSNAVLIMAGYAENEKREYLFKLKTKAFDEGVRTKFIGDSIGNDRSFQQGVKTYSLWDAYAHADLITFPSLWEGWGNQLLEGIFARKPLTIFEYPVFIKDIKSEGYHYISLYDDVEKQDVTGLFRLPPKNIKKAANKAVRWLSSPELIKKMEHNFDVGRKYHGRHILKSFLMDKLGLH